MPSSARDACARLRHNADTFTARMGRCHSFFSWPTVSRCFYSQGCNLAAELGTQFAHHSILGKGEMGNFPIARHSPATDSSSTRESCILGIVIELLRIGASVA